MVRLKPDATEANTVRPTAFAKATAVKNPDTTAATPTALKIWRHVGRASRRAVTSAEARTSGASEPRDRVQNVSRTLGDMIPAPYGLQRAVCASLGGRATRSAEGLRGLQKGCLDGCRHIDGDETTSRKQIVLAALVDNAKVPLALGVLVA
jgi:hypothetical protein